jgi:hypothetical protein
LTGPERSPGIAPLDVARFLVAFGLVPVLLVRSNPTWSFALDPTWSTGQLAFIALAGLVLGLGGGRLSFGLAGITIGALLGLGVDVAYLAGWVKPYDQTFVSLLPAAEWRSRLLVSALLLAGTAAASFAIGWVASRLIRERRARRAPRSRRPAASDAIAITLAVVAVPLLALGIATDTGAALVVPEGAQVQTIRVSAGSITADPLVLRSGPTRFLCIYSSDAAPAWTYFSAIAESGDAETATRLDEASNCGFEPGSVSWGTVADLRPGRYAWDQRDNYTEPVRIIATSPVVVVTPD